MSVSADQKSPSLLSETGTGTSAKTDASAGTFKDVFENKGVKVEFSIIHASAKEGKAKPIREAETAEISFRITDAATGSPITPLEPAVWVNLVKDKGDTKKEDFTCKDRIGLYLQGTIGFQADIDLNKFYMLVLNNDHTISVVDPILGITGITQLYAMIVLKDRGEDWVMSEDEKYLFVTMPKAGQVAVVDLETFKVFTNIEAGSNTVRIGLQPDGKYLWVGNNGSGKESGVTVIDARNHKVAAHIPTGAGHHEIDFSDDSLHAYITNSEANTLSVIDTQQLKKIKDLATGERPVAVEFSSLSKAAYIANEADGTIAVVDSTTNEITGRIRTEPGLITFRFAPGDRWGFAANPKRNKVYVLDVSSGSVAHTIDVGLQPHQFAFTDTFAYVRSLRVPNIDLIPLAQLGKGGKLALPNSIPIGSKAPGEYAFTSVADAISPTGEWDTVLAVNPADKLVYYYMEGMEAPMGTFPAYGRIPRAVRVIDRSLHEKEKGVYSAMLRIPKSGKYNVAFLIDSPWVYNCFEFTAEPNPMLAHAAKSAPPKIEFLTQKREIPAGESFALQFTLKDSSGDVPLSGLEDVMVLSSSPPGNRQNRQYAKPLADGVYEATLTTNRPGLYYVYFAVPSLNIDIAQMPYMIFRVTKEKSSAEGR